MREKICDDDRLVVSRCLQRNAHEMRVFGVYSDDIILNLFYHVVEFLSSDMHGYFLLPQMLPSACFPCLHYAIIHSAMADNDFDFSKITKAGSKEEWQKAFDEYSAFLDGGNVESSPSEKSSSVSPRPSSAKLKNIHSGHRERLRRSASHNDDLLGFTDIEVLETLLSYFIPYKDTNPIAHALLDKFGTLAGVLRASSDELFAVGSMTKTAAEMLPLISSAPIHAHKFDISLTSHLVAARFFASVFVGGAKDGVYIAFLDKRYRLIAVERHALKKSGAIDVRAILGSVAKHGAKSIIVARREHSLLSDGKVVEGMRTVKDALSYTDINLLDCMIFLDYGYYSMALSGADNEYIFLPTVAASGSPELADTILRSGANHNLD